MHTLSQFRTVSARNNKMWQLLFVGRQQWNTDVNKTGMRKYYLQMIAVLSGGYVLTWL